MVCPPLHLRFAQLFSPQSSFLTILCKTARLLSLSIPLLCFIFLHSNCHQPETVCLLISCLSASLDCMLRGQRPCLSSSSAVLHSLQQRRCSQTLNGCMNDQGSLHERPSKLRRRTGANAGLWFLSTHTAERADDPWSSSSSELKRIPFILC